MSLGATVHALCGAYHGKSQRIIAESQKGIADKSHVQGALTDLVQRIERIVQIDVLNVCVCVCVCVCARARARALDLDIPRSAHDRFT